MSERRRTANTDNVEARTFDFGDVPLGGHLPDASYDMKIASLEQRYSNEKGLLMYTIELRVEKPESMFGRGHYETLVFGTSPFDPGESKDPEFIAYAELNDPEAEDPLTLKKSRGVQTFKQLMHYAGVDMSGSVYMPDLVALCNAGTLKVGVRMRTEEQEDGRFIGTIRNRISHIYEIGREAPGFTPDPKSGNKRGGRREQAGAPSGRRRSAQPDNMQRALNSTRTRRQIQDDLADEMIEEADEAALESFNEVPTQTMPVASETD